MKKKNMRTKKKAEISIMTTFLVILLVVIAAIIFIYYENLIYILSSSTQQDLEKYEIAKDSREKIFYCYGNIIDENNLNKTCEINLIKGFTIKRLALQDCVEMEYNSTNISYYDEKFVYTIPIRDYNSSDICVGKLKIYT